LKFEFLKSPFSALQTDKAAAITEYVMVLLALLVTFVLIGISFPLLRDRALAALDARSLDWLTTNRSKLASWVEWSKIVFEVALALFISNQVFNEQLRAFFEASLQRLKTNLTSIIENSVKQDDARVEIRKALNDIVVFMYLPTDLRALPSDIPILLNASTTIYSQLRRGIPFLFVRLIALRVLGAFSGKLHGTAALMAFWGVLLMKVVKLYLDSPLLITPPTH
jgi:hypothetical protein